jgi:hypothetical protein
MVKYFSEKVAPAVHDRAEKKQCFYSWKEGWMHWRFAKQEKQLKESMEEEQAFIKDSAAYRVKLEQEETAAK